MKIYLLAGLMVMAVSTSAQDSSGKKQVNITSTFKPSLKEAAKINFNATPPTADTSRPRLQYSIPDQNLSFLFQPGSLKPLALQVDTGGKWDNDSYIKLGYGNLNTPFAQAGISFGDGKNTGFNIYAKHSSSKGNLPFQQYSNSNIDLNAFFKTAKNLEWDLRFGGYQEMYNKYGFEPKTLSFPDDSIKVKFQTWKARVAFQNINRTQYGLNYAPEMKVDVFNDQLNNSESNSYFNLPLQKSIGKDYEVDMALTANLSAYKADSKKIVANNYFSFAPSFVLKQTNVMFQAGIRPSWDNKDFHLYPNVLAEFNTNDKRFTFLFGWTGRLRNSGYEYQAEMNPWIWAPATVYNTSVEERYAGIKGTIGDHFSYGAKAAYNILGNQPLFVNDTMSGKSFLVVKESELKVVNLGGELAYNMGEKFSVVSNLSVNSFKTKDNAKAWGMLPAEWKTDLKLEVLKDLYVNSTLYIFDGPWSLTKTGSKNLPAAADFSAGLEFKIVKNVKLWAQFNNIFNKSYQRWNQYPVYGFNFLGGVVFSFAQKN
ncbi:MAG: hypothetical protein ACJ75B_01960 [Flavisolibacter sp.]